MWCSASFLAMRRLHHNLEPSISTKMFNFDNCPCDHIVTPVANISIMLMGVHGHPLKDPDWHWEGYFSPFVTQTRMENTPLASLVLYFWWFLARTSNHWLESPDIERLTNEVWSGLGLLTSREWPAWAHASNASSQRCQNMYLYIESEIPPVVSQLNLSWLLLLTELNSQPFAFNFVGIPSFIFIFQLIWLDITVSLFLQQLLSGAFYHLWGNLPQLSQLALQWTPVQLTFRLCW